MQFDILLLIIIYPYKFRTTTTTDWGIINSEFKTIHTATADLVKFDTLEQCIITQIGKKYGVIDLNGKTIVPYKYTNVSAYYGIFVGQINDAFFIYGKSGTLLYEHKSQDYNLGIIANIESLIWIGTVVTKRGKTPQELWIDAKNEKLYYLNSAILANAKEYGGEKLLSGGRRYFQKVAPLIVSLGYIKDGRLRYQYFDLAKGEPIGAVFDGVSITESITYWVKNTHRKEKVNMGDVITVFPAVGKGLGNIYRKTTAGSTAHTTEKTSWVFWGGTYRDGLALISQNNLFGFMDINGSIAIPSQYFDATSFSEGLAAVIADTSTALWSVIDTKGKEVLPASYSNLGSFSSGLCPAQIDDKVFFIDKKGTRFFEDLHLEGIQDFSEGFAGVKVNGKWGYINSAGKWLIKPQFDEVSPFSKGVGRFDMVSKRNHSGYADTTWGYINTKGEIIRKH